MDYIKSEMTLISDLERNREAVSTRDYLNFMSESIDEKISLLEMLKERYFVRYLEWSGLLTCSRELKKWRQPKMAISGKEEGRISNYSMICIDFECIINYFLLHRVPFK